MALTSPGITLAIVLIFTRPTSAETGITQMMMKPLQYLLIFGIDKSPAVTHQTPISTTQSLMIYDANQ